MSRFPYTAEDREDQVCQLIDARIKAIRTDILLGRQSTTDAVLARLHIDADEDEARAILWNAVVGGSSAVGVGLAHLVQLAMFEEAEVLAEIDVADMERRRVEDARHARIERRVWDRFFSSGAPA